MQKTLENHCRRRATPPHPWGHRRIEAKRWVARFRQVSATSAENITLLAGSGVRAAQVVCGLWSIQCTTPVDIGDDAITQL